MAKPRGPSAASRLAGFLAEYEPSIRRLARAVLAKMRRRLPGATQLVYDNYNALVVAFSATGRAGDAVFSIALYPRWVTLFFAKGAKLADPTNRLAGSGKTFRHVVLARPADLDAPDMKALFARALALAAPPIPKRGGHLVIQSVSPKRRPRRPAKRSGGTHDG